MSRQIIISDEFIYDTKNGNRIYKVEIEVPQNFKRKTANLVPCYEDFESYNTGGFTEKRQVGYECSKCKKKYYLISDIKYCAKCGAEIVDELQESEE